jgi:hypothetical protein
MSETLDQPAESWLNPLVDLLNRWNEFHAMGRVWVVADLCQHFLKANCGALVRWLDGNPLPYLTREVEQASLHAVLRTFERRHDDLDDGSERSPLAQSQRQELRDLRQRATLAAQDRLSRLARGQTVPWEGPDWDELEPRVRQLLCHMQDVERADLRELCPKVWGKEYLTDDGVTESARETATSKANRFLRKRGWPRRLAKLRDEPYLRWE